MHGGLPAAEKDRVMRNFKQAKTKLLVSTNVIEVGIDIPQATLMVILYPERFGLAQLHQLRGRVGRGDLAGRCMLILSEESSDEALERMNLFERTQNGFELAEIDLRLRGLGTLTGTRQTGGTEFRLASLPRDVELFLESAKKVKQLLKNEPLMDSKEHATLLKRIEQYWDHSIEMTEIA